MEEATDRVSENSRDTPQTQETTSDKEENEQLGETLLLIVTVDGVPRYHVQKEKITEALWDCANREYDKLLLTGQYSSIYFEPVGRDRINLIGARRFLIISHDSVLCTIACYRSKPYEA